MLSNWVARKVCLCPNWWSFSTFATFGKALFASDLAMRNVYPNTTPEWRAVVKEGAEGLCEFYGFLDQTASWMCNVAIIWIMLYMLWIVNKLQRVQRGKPDQIQYVYQNWAGRTVFSDIISPYIQLDSIHLEDEWYLWIKEFSSYCKESELGI